MKVPRTFEELCTWIEENVQDPENKTAGESAYWFVSCNVATQMRDVYTHKDWAELLLEGYKPIKDNPKYVTEFLESAYLCDDEEEDGDHSNEEGLLRDLKAHFGLE